MLCVQEIDGSGQEDLACYRLAKDTDERNALKQRPAKEYRDMPKRGNE